MKKYLFGIAFSLVFLVLPVLIQAAGIVPCGEAGNPCTLCHIFLLIKNIMDVILYPFIPLIATFLVIIGGIFFMLGGGNPQSLARARTILWSTAIGVVIIYASWAIVNTLLTVLGFAEFQGFDEGWIINCGG